MISKNGEALAYLGGTTTEGAKKLNKIDEKFFKRPVAISVGRLTKQKNFIDLIKNLQKVS